MILVWPLLFNVGLILLSFSAWCHEGFGRLHHEQQDSSAHGTPVVVKMEWSMKKPPKMPVVCIQPRTPSWPKCLGLHLIRSALVKRESNLATRSMAEVNYKIGKDSNSVEEIWFQITHTTKMNMWWTTRTKQNKKNQKKNLETQE